uniref:NADH-ubiquinone oxidoreductase chain 4L n=1 Tax=Scyllarides squammosus TaxID=1104396 RepID=A0A515L3A6_9EUCA|nr:NADH dehydrogenase subunit 4L [Scyllarides squammosus]QDM38506.1 NADH dehydrogenase subunit 4L [Scyllarides squammosus]
MMMLKLSLTMVPLFMVGCGLWSFVAKCKHLLNTLLSLEFVMLGVFFVLVVSLSFGKSDAYFVLYFLSMVACEGALGLSLLVSIVRTHGNDLYNSFSILQC